MASDFHDFANRKWLKPLIRPERGKWKGTGGGINTIPAMIYAPTITGIPTQGQTLTADVGFWTQIPSLLHGPPLMNEATVLIPNGFTYEQLGGVLESEDGSPLYSSYFQWQWLQNGFPIFGGVGPIYTLTAGDVGQLISVEVLAQNIIGLSPPGFSRQTAPIAALLAVSGTPVTTATHLQPYTGFTVSGTGGWAPYTYNLITGFWPVGITMDGRTGVISGVPKSAGVLSNITIQITDRYGETATLAPFTLTVS